MTIEKTIAFKITVIIICITTTAFTLNQYAKLIHHLLSINYNWLFELMVVLGMLFFQFLFIYKNTWRLKLDYYVNMMLVSLTGSLLLWPLIIVNLLYHCSDAVNVLYFLAVVTVMFFDHKKKVAQLQLPVFISYTWILYRFIILIFIL